MSRIGKLPVAIPEGVQVSIADGIVSVQGPRGKIACPVQKGIGVEEKEGALVVSMLSNGKEAKARYGTMRAHLNNMVIGVTTGWKKTLELNGVGFTAQFSNGKLTLSVGYSHKAEVAIPPEVKCDVNKTIIDLESNDRQLVGAVAAGIRQVCPPEPYLGKGIKYADEQIRRKAGKAGKK